MTKEMVVQDMNEADAKFLISSKYLPDHVQNAAQAIVIAMKGKEVGMGPMQSFQHIHVIKGKPTISAEGQHALIRKNCPQAKIFPKELTREKCVITASRPGHEPFDFEFSIDDAKVAGLLGNPSWTKYPKNMLWARCMSNVAKMMFPDCIVGLSYTPEELGAEVNEDGEIINVGPEKKAEGGFDPNNKELKAWLETHLTNRGISREFWPEISGKLTGKPGSEFESVIKQFMIGDNNDQSRDLHSEGG